MKPVQDGELESDSNLVCLFFYLDDFCEEIEVEHICPPLMSRLSTLVGTVSITIIILSHAMSHDFTQTLFAHGYVQFDTLLPINYS